MKKIVAGGMLLGLLATAASAQTTSPPPELTLPPGLANMPETKWGTSDLPTGLSNERSQRDWDTPPGWTNANSQGWQNGGGTTSGGAGHSSMAGGKGKGK